MSRMVTSSLLLFLLALSMFTLAFGIRPVGASATTITVPDDYVTIGAAENAANSGDTVYVRAGIYYEHVIVHKPLSLVGEDAGDTIIDGGGKDVVILILADYVSVSGFTIRNSEHWPVFGAGVELRNANHCNITGNNITGNDGDGVYFDFSGHDDTISDNNITGNGGWGVALFSSGNIVSRNKLANNGVGVYMYLCSFSIVSDNCMTNNIGGFVLGSGYNNIVSENNITYNEAGFDLGDSSSGNRVFHNNFIGNTRPADVTITSSVNTWDDGYPEGGNYWSNYFSGDVFRGVYQNETGRDGIGDVPYFVDANNKDCYPLLQPWTEGISQSWTFVSCAPNPSPFGSLVTCTATVARFDPSGTVVWSTNSSTGSFTQSVCTLSSGTCATTYADTSLGTANITASYGGDSNNKPSSFSTTLRVSRVYYLNVTSEYGPPTPKSGWFFDGTTVTAWVVSPSILGKRYSGALYTCVGWNGTGNVPAFGEAPWVVFTINSNSSITWNWNATNICDLRGTGTVDMMDIGMAASAFGTVPGDVRWNPAVDVAGPNGVPDGLVDLMDISFISSNFGWTASLG